MTSKRSDGMVLYQMSQKSVSTTPQHSLSMKGVESNASQNTRVQPEARACPTLIALKTTEFLLSLALLVIYMRNEITQLPACLVISPILTNSLLLLISYAMKQVPITFEKMSTVSLAFVSIVCYIMIDVSAEHGSAIVMFSDTLAALAVVLFVDATVTVLKRGCR